MSIYLWHFYSAVRVAWKSFIEGTFAILSGISPLFIKAYLSNPQKPNDLESNDTVDVVTYTIQPLILRLLQQWPHPHIVEAIDTDQAEGIFLRRYQPLPEGEIPAQPIRIRWYRDIANALCHLHKLRIAYRDVRIDNILLDNRGSAVLCDFSAASPFSQSNFVISDLPLLVNGPSPNLS